MENLPNLSGMLWYDDWIKLMDVDYGWPDHADRGDLFWFRCGPREGICVDVTKYQYEIDGRES